MEIEKFDSLESTNKYCEALDLASVGDFTCYWALRQTAGIGQQGNHWEAEPGKNLTFSLVLHPTFLPADRQFRLTMALSLAVVDFLSTFNLQSPVSIKWPNDIYVPVPNTVEGRERRRYGKICGTLVSTRLQGRQIASAVCGIGLNINQVDFPTWVPHPTSLALLTGQHFELEPLLRQLLACVEKRYAALRHGHNPEPDYLAHLLNLHTPARYKYKGEEFTATITGIDPYGRLLLATTDGQSLCCGMKEVALLKQN